MAAFLHIDHPRIQDYHGKELYLDTMKSPRHTQIQNPMITKCRKDWPGKATAGIPRTNTTIAWNLNQTKHRSFTPLVLCGVFRMACKSSDLHAPHSQPQCRQHYPQSVSPTRIDTTRVHHYHACMRVGLLPWKGYNGKRTTTKLPCEQRREERRGTQRNAEERQKGCYPYLAYG